MEWSSLPLPEQINFDTQNPLFLNYPEFLSLINMTNTELYSRERKTKNGTTVKEWWVRVWSAGGNTFEDVPFEKLVNKRMLYETFG